MRLTILGSGTVVPNGTRNSAGYFIELPDARLMMDCGAGTVHALARYGLPWEQMSHLFVSHFHVDHVGELASLFFAFLHGMKTERTGPLTLIGPRGLDRVMEGLKFAFGSNLFETNFPVSVRLLARRREISSPILISASLLTNLSSSILASSSAIGCSKSRKFIAIADLRTWKVARR